LYSYDEKSKLVDSLVRLDVRDVVNRYIKKDNIDSKELGDIMYFAFGSNIKRRFHNEDPSDKYIKWSWYSKPDQIIRTLNTIAQQVDYDAFIDTIRRSLVKEWGNKNNVGEQTKMNDGIAMKIVNLIMKHMAYSKYISNRNIYNYLHVPWDSNTLLPLRNLFNSAQSNFKMPKDPKQGFVDTLILHQINLEK